ncbi:hypothetical protein pb186bvf_002400 [Paramecium bursaria]
MEQPNHRLVVQSEPRLRTNQQDLNRCQNNCFISQFDRISQTEPRKDDKENTLILAAENNQLYGFDIYRDSNLGISECFQKLLCVDRGFDFDVETTWSELSNIKREWAHEVNERMNWSNSETTMSEPSISNKPSKGQRTLIDNFYNQIILKISLSLRVFFIISFLRNIIFNVFPHSNLIFNIIAEKKIIQYLIFSYIQNEFREKFQQYKKNEGGSGNGLKILMQNQLDQVKSQPDQSLQAIKENYQKQIFEREQQLIQIKKEKMQRVDALEDLQYELDVHKGELHTKLNEIRHYDSSIQTLMDSIQKNRAKKKIYVNQSAQYSEPSQFNSLNIIKGMLKNNILDDNFDKIERFSSSRIPHD